MLRHTIARSALRRTVQSVNVAKSFATSGRRQAEVELTIGV